MSLEDPLSLTGLPPAQSVQQKPSTGLLHRVRITDLSAFRGLVSEPRAVVEIDEDMAWHERLIIRAHRINRFLLPKLLVAFAALLIFLALVVPVRYLLGYSTVVPVLVTAELRDVHSPNSPLAYRWLNGVADATIGEHVLAARRGLIDAPLVLVASATDDSAPARTLSCAELLTHDLAARQALVDLMAAAEQYLEKTPSQTVVCSPQLGSNQSYIVFRQAAGFFHIFNPVDSSAEEYETLDGDRLAQLGIGLERVVVNQNYRYNVARGSFALLRRLQLSIVGVDATCQRSRVAVKDGLAIGAGECLDLLRGVDVLERARRQFERGVIFNAEYFHALARGDTVGPHDVAVDEVKIEL
jgi:hypothetical protein